MEQRYSLSLRSLQRGPICYLDIPESLYFWLISLSMPAVVLTIIVLAWPNHSSHSHRALAERLHYGQKIAAGQWTEGLQYLEQLTQQGILKPVESERLQKQALETALAQYLASITHGQYREAEAMAHELSQSQQVHTELRSHFIQQIQRERQRRVALIRRSMFQAFATYDLSLAWNDAQNLLVFGPLQETTTYATSALDEDARE